MSIDAMKQALEALEYIYTETTEDEDELIHAATTSLRLAIEQAEKQEPVAWMVYTLDGTAAWVTLNPADFTSEHRALPLYTTPPQRQPLTEEEVERIHQRYGGNMINCVRAIERAHGIGGGE